MSLEKLTHSEKIDRLKKTLLSLIPHNSNGQLPYILRRQADARLDYRVKWGYMQEAFDELYEEGKVYPEQDFKHSITKRASLSLLYQN